MRFIDSTLLTLITAFGLLGGHAAQAHVAGADYTGSQHVLLHYLTSPEHWLLALIPAVGLVLFATRRR